ncbi:MAG TPA: hypothetical protein VHL31_00915 [Geminicoccus sp.]|jgi:hypothetical protein|uniref:hypothetical protein n=1 Tax=Geminicoccus sp. TaxID=2024832 RepID=UPI002E2EA82B|nr:hypothetical protein [Geminicoccus sp.]HEX2524850.1 hypothetical protein [Geminicoccus sp.]
MSRTHRPEPDVLADLTKVDTLQLVDRLDEAWRRSIQLNLMIAGMVLPERVRGPSAELTKLEAAWCLSSDAVYGLGQLKETLGACEEETTLE